MLTVSLVVTAPGFTTADERLYFFFDPVIAVIMYCTAYKYILVSSSPRLFATILATLDT